jgi:uncharacterized repeat protein (TIGR03803 family)
MYFAMRHRVSIASLIGLGSVLCLSMAGRAQTYTVLHNFNGPDGSDPVAGLVLDPAGNLYGTTAAGGARGTGAGTVFTIDFLGNETVLHSFGGTDGQAPQGGLVRDAAGNLYGTTYGGGFGFGLVFKLDPAGHEILLHKFDAGSDGSEPEAGLIMDSAGNLYGTTYSGGVNSAGTVFKVEPSGAETVLYSFVYPNTGGYPRGSLVMDDAGNLYGTTAFGGDRECLCGEVFKLDPSGVETVLHPFHGNDGYTPNAGLVMDAAGNLYGTTSYGGDLSCVDFEEPAGCGVVFKLDPAGHETVLHYFTGSPDGASPFSSLLLDADGSLYGTTFVGGSHARGCGTDGCGTVFRIDPSGAETVVYTFQAFGTGYFPYSAALISDAAGNLYGTTSRGGIQNNNHGVVFKLTPP